VISKISSFTGFDIVSPKRNRVQKALAALNIFILMTVTVCTINTVIAASPDHLEAMKASLPMGFIVLTFVKMINISMNRAAFDRINKQVTKMYKIPENSKEPEQIVLQKSIKTCTKHFMAYSGIQLTFTVLFVAYPLVSAIFFGKFILMIPNQLLYTDPQTLSGFLINYAIQFLHVGFLALLNMPFDATVSLFAMHTKTMAELLDLKLIELETHVRMQKVSKKHKREVKKVPEMLKKIIELQLQLNNFIESFGDYYLAPIYSCAATNLYTISIAMVLAVDGHWIPAYFVLIAAIVQLFACFLSGTIIDTQVRHFALQNIIN